MDDNLKDKLEKILSKHSNKFESIKHFDELFDKLKLQVDELVNRINTLLQRTTGEILEVAFNDPYSIPRSNYIIIVKLQNKYKSTSLAYLLSQDEASQVQFLGNEYKGFVSIINKYVILDGNNKKSSEQKVFEGPIAEINVNLIENILIDFIDKVYSI